MNTPRYLLAKYIPDHLRMEPRNIGVVLWAEGNVTARFFGESDATDSRSRCRGGWGFPIAASTRNGSSIGGNKWNCRHWCGPRTAAR